jgi:hypothetical protein
VRLRDLLRCRLVLSAVLRVVPASPVVSAVLVVIRRLVNVFALPDILRRGVALVELAVVPLVVIARESKL